MGLERGSIEPRVSASNVLSMNCVISFTAYATLAAKGVVVCADRWDVAVLITHAQSTQHFCIISSVRIIYKLDSYSNSQVSSEALTGVL